MNKKVIIKTSKGKVLLDIPGEHATCEQELDQLIERMQNFVPEQRLVRSPKEKNTVEVNRT